MNMRRLGKTNLMVSEVGFGGEWLGRHEEAESVSLIRYAHRHAELARKMAAEEKDPARKAELEKIASNCDWVPENPPRDFWEALQLERFIYLAESKNIYAKYVEGRKIF